MLGAGGPSGLYHRGIQFTAPNSAKASSLGSPCANTPAAIPSSITRRTPLSKASRRAITALRCSGGQRFEIEKQRRAVQLVEDRVDERVDQPPQLDVGGRAAAVDLLEQLRQPIERVLVAGEEDLFLVLEVVVEVPLLHVQRRGDLLRRWRRDSRGGGTPWRRFSGCRRGSRPGDRRCAAASGASRGRAWRRARWKGLTRSLPQL